MNSAQQLAAQQLAERVLRRLNEEDLTLMQGIVERAHGAIMKHFFGRWGDLVVGNWAVNDEQLRSLNDSLFESAKRSAIYAMFSANSELSKSLSTTSRDLDAICLCHYAASALRWSSQVGLTGSVSTLA